MSYAPKLVGTAIEVNNGASGAVPWPSVVNAGDAIFLGCIAGPTGGAFTPSDTAFSSAAVRTANATIQLFWKIADGTESGTTNVAYNTGGQAFFQMCSFTGGPNSTLSGVHNSATTGSSAAAGLLYPSMTITTNNCLVIVLGGKPINASGFNVPTPFDAEIAENGSANGLCMVWDYAIQTVATSIVGGAWTISSDGSAPRNAVMAAFNPGIAVVSPPTSGGIFVTP